MSEIKNFGLLKPLLTIIDLVDWDIKYQEMYSNIDFFFTQDRYKKHKLVLV